MTTETVYTTLGEGTIVAKEADEEGSVIVMVEHPDGSIGTYDDDEIAY
ncbi:hypothetical protein H6F43_04205 [Leptolyngbya sp. FACHB-36]|nr:hypothetical protein [Leptolyngbya sp. FACHB-36]MBD2019386.1 hypothetical protein [Leptolyngbya sp. FACHB-36]